MPKIFYTIEEACAQLGKTEAEIMALIQAGKLREFRDQEQLKLKVEDVNSLNDSDVDIQLNSDQINLSSGSGSFELDLSDSLSPTIASDPKSASPVGPLAPPAIEDDLALDLDSMASAETPSIAQKNELVDDTFTLEMDLDSSSPATSAAQSAAQSAAASSVLPEAGEDSLTLELDLGEDKSPAPAPKNVAPQKAAPEIDLNAGLDDLEFEDNVKGDVAKSPAKIAAKTPLENFDQTIEDNREGSAAGFDSRIDSALGGSADLVAETMNVDQPGSGSGLLDLTQESEDSQMGAALMDEAFQGDDEAPKNASGIFGGASNESGIHEAAVASIGSSTGSVPAFASATTAGIEIYSASWSGLTIGLLVPAIVGLTATAAMLVVKTLGGTPDLAIMVAQDWMMWTGGYAGSIAICGAIGFFVGKATE
ncbi:MAG: hypothetical protein EXS12_00660 [Phycisphaerales bacterium]|nr:hypothetical protein [Phycisphaerales bacterium]